MSIFQGCPTVHGICGGDHTKHTILCAVLCICGLHLRTLGAWQIFKVQRGGHGIVQLAQGEQYCAVQLLLKVSAGSFTHRTGLLF